MLNYIIFKLVIKNNKNYKNIYYFSNNNLKNKLKNY